MSVLDLDIRIGALIRHNILRGTDPKSQKVALLSSDQRDLGAFAPNPKPGTRNL